MRIRKAVAGDYRAVMELYNAFVGEDRYSRYDNDSFGRVIKNPRNRLLVAEDDGRLAGFASFSVRDVVRYPRPIAELDELYVDPAFRTHGIGRQLMSAMEEYARQANCYRLFIESAYQHTGAHQFYEKLGYKNNGYHYLKDL